MRDGQMEDEMVTVYPMDLLPPLRLFTVNTSHITSDCNGVTIYTDEQVLVEAHELSLNEGVLLFITHSIAQRDGDFAKVSYVRRGFAPGSWLDFEEVLTPGQVPSVGRKH